VLFRRAQNRTDIALITADSVTRLRSFTAIYLHVHLYYATSASLSHLHQHFLTNLTRSRSPFLRLIALPSYHPNPTHDRQMHPRGQASARCSAMRSKKDDHPSPARSYCLADMRPCCWNSISAAVAQVAEHHDHQLVDLVGPVREGEHHRLGATTSRYSPCNGSRGGRGRANIVARHAPPP
jgi:hypothetical protein